MSDRGKGKSRSAAELEAERDFLAARLQGDYTWVGISSNAMVLSAIHDRPIPTIEYPHDWADYGRCVRTRDRAPRHLRPVMDHWLSVWERHVEAQYPREEWDQRVASL